MLGGSLLLKQHHCSGSSLPRPGKKVELGQDLNDAVTEPATHVKTGVKVGVVIILQPAVLTSTRLATSTGGVLLVTQETGTWQRTLSTCAGIHDGTTTYEGCGTKEPGILMVNNRHEFNTFGVDFTSVFDHVAVALSSIRTPFTFWPKPWCMNQVWPLHCI